MLDSVIINLYAEFQRTNLSNSKDWNTIDKFERFFKLLTETIVLDPSKSVDVLVLLAQENDRKLNLGDLIARNQGEIVNQAYIALLTKLVDLQPRLVYQLLSKQNTFGQTLLHLIATHQTDVVNQDCLALLTRLANIRPLLVSTLLTLKTLEEKGAIKADLNFGQCIARCQSCDINQSYVNLLILLAQHNSVDVLAIVQQQERILTKEDFQEEYFSDHRQNVVTRRRYLSLLKTLALSHDVEVFQLVDFIGPDFTEAVVTAEETELAAIYCSLYLHMFINVFSGPRAREATEYPSLTKLTDHLLSLPNNQPSLALLYQFVKPDSLFKTYCTQATDKNPIVNAMVDTRMTAKIQARIETMLQLLAPQPPSTATTVTSALMATTHYPSEDLLILPKGLGSSLNA